MRCTPSRQRRFQLPVAVSMWVLLAAAAGGAATEPHTGGRRPEPQEPELRLQALAALGEGEFDAAARLWLERLRLDPAEPAPLAHLALHLNWMPGRQSALEQLEEIAALPLAPESRRLADALREGLCRKLGHSAEGLRLAGLRGTFRSFARISFPKRGLDLFTATRLPGPADRLDVDLLEPVPPTLRPADWNSTAQVAWLWGGFELAQPEEARITLETDDPARLLIDGYVALEVDPQMGVMASRTTATLQLGTGWHRVLLLSARGSEPWELRLNLQSTDGSPLPLVPVQDLEALEKEPFARSLQSPSMEWPEPATIGADAFLELDAAALEMERGELFAAEDRLTALAATAETDSRARPFVELYLALCHQRAAARGLSSARHRLEGTEALRRAVDRGDAPPLLRWLAAEALYSAGDTGRSGALWQAEPGQNCLAEALKADWLGSSGRPAEHLEALKQANACGAHMKGPGKALAEELLRRGRVAESLQAASATLEQNAEDRELRLWLASELGAEGRVEEALAVCRSGEPEAGPVPTGLCEGSALLRAGERERARETFQTAVNVAPASLEAVQGLAAALELAGETEGARQRREDAERQSGDGRGDMPALIEDLDTPLERLLEDAARPPAPAAPPGRDARGLRAVAELPAGFVASASEVAAGASSIQLLDIGIVSFEGDGRFREYYHGALQALDASAREQAGELHLPGDARLLHARVRLRDGRVLLPEQIQKDASTQVVSFYGLEDGAIADWSWERNARPLEEIATRFAFAGAETPLLLSRMCLAGDHTSEPVGVEVRLEARLESRDGLAAGRKVRCWERRLVPASPVEPAMPDLLEVEPAVIVSFRFPESELRSGLLRRLQLAGRRDGRLSRAARGWLPETGVSAEAIYRIVQERIVEGDDAETPLDALVLGRGTADQRLGLAHLLCELAGIPASLAIASASPGAGGALQGSRLGQLVLEVDPGGWERRLVWTLGSPLLGPHAVDPAIVGTRLTALRAGVLSEAPGPAAPLDRDSLWYVLEVFILQDGSAEVEGTVRARGASAAALREALALNGTAAGLARGVSTGLFPALELTASAVEGREPSAKELSIGFSGRVPQWLGPGASERFRPLPLPGRIGELTASVSRRYPLVLDEPLLSDRARIVYRLGPDMQFGDIPAPMLEAGPFGGYSLSFVREGTDLVVERSATLPPQRIEPDSYPGFRTLCLSIDRAEAQTVEVLRSGPGPL